jgi:S-methylmethionine-dependent homocysteine/selenocysteine methylase
MPGVTHHHTIRISSGCAQVGRNKMTDILRMRLKRRTPLVLDGAMGTELQRRGVDTGLPMWSANALFGRPAIIQQIHEEYLLAGADIITTNTFRTTRRTMGRANLPDRSKQLTETAVQLALRAREKHPDGQRLVAGSMAPLEDCYRPDLVPPDAELKEHEELAGRLAAAGVDIILIETMNTVREAYAACSAAVATGLDVIVSFVCNREGTLLSGETLEDAVMSVAELSPAGFSVNCVSPRFMEKAITSLSSQVRKTRPEAIVAAYGNIGNPESDVHGWEFTNDVSAEQYAQHASAWSRLGVSIVGGCCGTTPVYIEAATQALRGGRERISERTSKTQSHRG